MGFQGHLFIS